MNPYLHPSNEGKTKESQTVKQLIKDKNSTDTVRCMAGGDPIHGMASNTAENLHKTEPPVFEFVYLVKSMHKLPLNAALMQNIVFFILFLFIRHRIYKPIHSVGYKIKNKCLSKFIISIAMLQNFVCQIFISSFNVHHLTAHSGKPYKF